MTAQFINLHLRLRDPSVSKHEKRIIHDHHAPDYDQYVFGLGYVGYGTVVDSLIPYLPPHPRILDVGCGTGLCATYMAEKHPTIAKASALIGMDISKGMLAQAERTGLYHHLSAVDITMSFEVPGGQVDAILAAGVFLDGYVPPEGLTPVLSQLRPGGVASISVREASFKLHTKEYLRIIADARCEIVLQHLSPYLVEENAMYLIVRKF